MTQVVSTSPGTDAVPLGVITTVTLEPARGAAILVADPNNRRTESAYDPLGRSVAIWQPNRARKDNPAKPGYACRYRATPAPTAISDAQGRIVEQRQHRSRTDPTSYDSTKYTYNRAGQRETLTNAAGEVWRYTYDLLGRQTGGRRSAIRDT